MPSQEVYEDVVIETALITDVDMRRWTVDLMTQFSDKTLTGIPWSSPYIHPERGEGFLYVPEVGAQCLLVTPSDGEVSPFIIGFLPVPREDTYRSNRIDMNPGDMGFMTRDGNFVICRRGGVVQIGSTKTAQRMYLPVENTIRDFAQNYSLTTYGGELVWETDVQAAEGGKTPTRYVLRGKAYAEHESGGKEYFPIVLTLGETLPKGDKSKRSGEDNLKTSGMSDTEAPLVELSVSLPGKVELNIAVDGNGNFYAKANSGTWNFEKDLIVRVKGDRTVTVDGTDTMKAQKRVEEYDTHEVSYTSSEEKGQSKSIDTLKAFIGDSKLPSGPPIIGPEFVKALPAAFEVIVQTPAGPQTGKLVPGPGFGALANAFSKTVKIT